MIAAGNSAKNAFNSAIRGIGSGMPKNLPGPVVKPRVITAPPIPWKSWDAFFKDMPIWKKSTQDILSRQGYRNGGYTGAGPAGAEAGIVHKGEYVIPKQDVNQSTGLPYADALGRLMGGLPSRSVAPASSSGQSGTPVVALSAGTIQAIAQATNKAIYLDGRMIADATSDVYAHQYSVGAN